MCSSDLLRPVRERRSHPAATPSSRTNCWSRRSPSTACAVSTDLHPVLSSGALDRPLVLHPQVALRAEPFGALAYHYGNRRLVFLKHPDVVAVVSSLVDHPSPRAALEACGIAAARWPSFERALSSLVDAQVLHER